MKCTNCPNAELNGRAFETSELCEGPIDGSLAKGGEQLVAFRGVCNAVVAQHIMEGQYIGYEVDVYPSEDPSQQVIDLTDQPSTIRRIA